MRVRIAVEATSKDYTKRYLGPTEAPLEGFVPKTIQNYIDEFGGSLEGELDDPWGNIHDVSLAPLAELPRDLYLMLMFISVPDDRDFRENVYPNAIVLKEFSMPDVSLQGS